MHRLFVALRPPAAVRERLAGTMTGVAGARWQDDEQLHLTLRFIGEVEGPVAEDLALALAGIRAPVVEAQVAGVGMFDRRGRAGVLWAGLTPAAPLAALHHKIDQALVRVGLAPEGRAYRPHITLARLNAPVAAVERWLADHAGLRSPLFRMEAVLLFESHLGSEGARYEAVARVPLG